MNRRHYCSVLACTIAIAGALTTSVARAESAPAAPRCRVELLPNGNAPANLPALVVDDLSSPGLTSTLVIKRVSGGTKTVTLTKITDPTDPKVTLLVNAAKEPFDVGATYEIAYGVTCSAGQAVADDAIAISAGPVVALPTSIGTVTVLANGKARIAASAELIAFERTTRFEAFVDGERIGTTRYGATLKDELDVSLTTYGLEIGTTFVSRAKICTSKDPAEKHEAKLVAHVAGADGDTAPLVIPLTVDCSDRANGSTGAGGSSGSGSAGTLPDGGADDRGASGGGTDGGCTVAGQNPIGRLACLFMAGAGAAVLMRRRRRTAQAR